MSTVFGLVTVFGTSAWLGFSKMLAGVAPSMAAKNTPGVVKLFLL